MEVKQALMERRSIRGFQERPVSKEILREVLTLATRAVSATNSQPWELAIVTGKVLDELRRANAECFRGGMPVDYQEQKPAGVYRTRQIEVAKQLFASMEIAREDREKRGWWTERGFRFFDAPAGILVCMDSSLHGDYRLEIGCVVQNICTAAMEYGLGTCVAYQPVIYQSGARKLLGIPATKELICGIAIGYPDDSFPANQVVSHRESLDAVTTWYGF